MSSTSPSCIGWRRRAACRAALLEKWTVNYKFKDRDERETSKRPVRLEDK